MAVVDMDNKSRQQEQWEYESELTGIKEELEILGLDKASIGFQEVFKSAPKQVLRPARLVEWCIQIVKEGIKMKLGYHDLLVIVRTKAVKNFYSSQQAQASLDYAVREVTANFK